MFVAISSTANREPEVNSATMSGHGMGGKGFGLGFGVGRRHRMILRDGIRGITKPAIRRICRRAGVKRISGTPFQQMLNVSCCSRGKSAR
jgi:hypothetical protein